MSAFISVYKLDLICLSETCLNSETLPDDKYLEILGYNFIRKDHPSNTKRGDVCVYFKNTLPFKLIGIKYLQACITFEIRIGRKCFKFICLYRFPSQTNEKFESISKHFELTSHLHISIKFSHGIRSSFIFTSKMSSSGSLCKI